MTITSGQPLRKSIPNHVPEALVLPIGLTEGAEFLSNPHGFMASLHDTHPPIFYSLMEHAEDTWVVTGHGDCLNILRDHEVFTTRGSFQFPRDPDNYFEFIPIEIEPPEHRKYRAILDPLFTPRAIAQMELQMRSLASGLIDSFIDHGGCEFTTEFSRPFPVSVFLNLMGLPLDMRDTFVGWVMGLLHGQSRDVAAKSMREISSYLATVIKEKHKQPDDGVISTIVRATPGGSRLSEREIFGFVFFLFIAGLDTVFATLNNVFLWLAQHGERKRELILEPSLQGAAMNEMIRCFGVTFAGRILAQDHEMHGVDMKKGDRVVCVLPAANYDPKVFENPKITDFRRPLRPVLSFSGGSHSCMGRHLAQMEMDIALSEILKRIPDFTLKENSPIEYWPGGVVGPRSLPLIW